MDFIYYQDFESDGVTIEIRNRIEVCQGGPQIGYLYLNGVLLDDQKRFSGPIIVRENCAFLSEYSKGFWSSHFQLVKLNLETRELEKLPVKSDFVAPISIAGGTLIYALDVSGEKQDQLQLDQKQDRHAIKKYDT